MEKIDFVITWVDGSDEKWLAKKKRYKDRKNADSLAGRISEDGGNTRYRDWGLLPFVFRGIEKCAPWVNRVYLVTDEQVPSWLNTECPKLELVDHKDFIPMEYLPTFSANVIELNLHRIKGLSEQFVFFNDDFFLFNPCGEEDFFKKGMPCDEGTLNGINGKDEIFAGILFQDISLMNRHYSIRDVKKHLSKWLNLKYGKNVVRTLLLLPFQRLQGIYNHHGPISLKKSTYEKVWKRDSGILAETCTRKFRTGQDVSGYIFRYEQLLSGEFIPRKSLNHYLEVTSPIEEIEKAMKKAKMACINDTETDDVFFERRKEELHKMFLKKFPRKSMFEKS